MTAQRQENKGRGCKIATFAGIAGLIWMVLPVTPGSAAATERVVVNRYTGLAIDGFDPVAYFTDAQAMPGDPEVELLERGAIWRFRNGANRAAFIEHPEIYSPRYGGYDPTDIAQGKPVVGKARYWLIHAERLYLFNREETMTVFTASPDSFVEQADARWPDVYKRLSDY